MPKRSEKRDAAKAEYLARKGRGELVDLRELAEGLGVNYQTLRNWKSADEWEKAEPKKKRGGQPGNRNSAGHKNAAGSHKGAPAGNHNAEKDGAYSTIFFDTLSEAERELVMNTPVGSRAALEHEMQILKFREHRILTKIIEYEQAPEDELYLNSVLDMRQPAGRGDKKIDGARQQMGMNIHIFHAVSPRHVKYVCCIFVPYIVNNIFRKISYFAKWLESIEKQDGFPSC